MHGRSARRTRPLLRTLAATIALAAGALGGSVSAQVEVLDPSGSFRARVEMSSAQELREGGFCRWGSAHSAFDGRTAIIGGRSYEEWMQRDDCAPSVWWRTIDHHRGFRVEARLRVLEAGRDRSGIGLWIHDGRRMFKVFFRDGSVGIGYPFAQYVAVDTRVFRVYTIEARGEWIRVSVDGRPVLERRGPSTMEGAGTPTLMFGNLGEAPGIAEWDYLEYDTRPELPEPSESEPLQLE